MTPLSRSRQPHESFYLFSHLLLFSFIPLSSFMYIFTALFRTYQSLCTFAELRKATHKYYEPRLTHP